METIKDLQERCGKAAAAKGFHEDRPTAPLESASARISDLTDKQYADRLRDWQGNKLMLIVSEVAEAQDELRKGYPADLTYHPSDHFGAPTTEGPHKPEGVPSELADVVIRVLDFCYTEGIDLESIIEEKLAYNATREHKHGKKF